jgi:predicted dehydrogenase
MDTGCYAVHLLRHLAQSEPVVTSARAKWTSGGVDRWLTADLQFPTGATGRVTCGLLQPRLLSIAARVVGSEGSIHVINFVAPQFLHRLRVRTRDGARSVRVAGNPTYDYRCGPRAASATDGLFRRVRRTPSKCASIESTYAAAGRSS